VSPTSLRRSLSLWQVSLSGVGVILGAGVYALIGPAAAQAGNALWLAFVLAGLTAGLTRLRELGNFAEEMRDPERDLPRALFASMGVTTVIYVLVALSAVAVVDAARLGTSDAPLALVVGRALGERADTTISLLALAATANAALLLLVSASRSIYGMAAAGALPRRLARVGRTAVPVSSTLLVLALLTVLVALGTLRQVAAMTDAVVLVGFLFVNASLPWLAARRRTPASGRTRVAEILIPSLACLLCTWLLLHAGVTSIIAALGLALVMLATTSSGGMLTMLHRRKIGEVR
jgi:amino acid transporter